MLVTEPTRTALGERPVDPRVGSRGRVEALHTPLGLGPLRPGWQTGAWTQDPRYNDPAGACPADQPPPNYDGIKVPAAPSGTR